MIQLIKVITCQWKALKLILEGFKDQLDLIIEGVSGPKAKNTQLIPLESMCISVDGGEPVDGIPCMVWDQVDDKVIDTIWIDPVGNEIQGAVEVLKSCECKCDDCSCSTSILMDGFDSDPNILEVGESSAFAIRLDEVEVAAIVHDYTTTSDELNKSTFYTPIIDAINALADWSITLQEDVGIKDTGKPQWLVEYTGEGPAVLEIFKAGTAANVYNSDVLTITVLDDCTILGKSSWDGQGSDPFTAT